MRTIEELDNALYKLSDELLQDIRKIKGDIIILGAGGKMGPSLAKLAQLAVNAAHVDKKIIAVSRFTDLQAARDLNDIGIETISADLMDERSLQQLPDVENVLYMAGTKFGTTGNEPNTWAMNAYLPGRVATKFRSSRIVVFSTGNVYPLTPSDLNGPTEDDNVGPIGEYAQSCLGRERVFEYFSKIYHTPILIYRLNYAIDLRYGVLLEIAKAVRTGKEIDLAMGYVNILWQGDANQIAIRSLLHCAHPVQKLNVTGTQKLAVKWIAQEFGNLFRIEPRFVNEPKETALLSNASKMDNLFSYQKVSVDEMIRMTAEWLMAGGPLLDKPTHFQERTGKF